jgi:putative flavoprotein involved in K+ transport
MTTQHIDTLIIGAGQAGLATGYFLAQRGLDFLIVDGADRIGDNWREQWDTLRLYTPAKYDGLPGLPFPADDPWHFPGKDEVGDYLEAYALHWDLPVRMSTRVERLEPAPGGGYLATLGPDAVSTISCNQVVIATGTFGRTPWAPAGAADLDPRIVQLHSSAYRRPAQLPRGPVLVVGASHSGKDVAYDLAPTHETILCGREPGELSFRLDSPAARIALPLVMLMFKHVLSRRTPIGRKQMDHVRFHGGPGLRVKLVDLDARGVTRTQARFTGARDGRPLLDDGRVVEVASIVWCTGFQQRFDWIALPIFDERGWPVEYRGVTDGAPGLYFCGLSFQYAFSSMMLPGVGRDAAYVAEQIVTRQAYRRVMVDA